MVTLNNFFAELHEMWATEGPPAETFGAAGPFFRQLNKTTRGDWQGKGEAQLPVITRLNGAVGPVFAQVRTNAQSSDSDQFLVPSAEMWAVLPLPNKFLAFTRDPTYLESQMSGKKAEIERTAAAWMRAMSYTMWGDGKGLVGKGDGAYDVAGSVITLRNRASYKCFEEGDKIRLVLTATESATNPGEKAAPEAGELTVTAVSKTGTITVSETINVAIPTAVNTAWITKSVYHGSTARLPTGVFGWLGKNETEAAKPLYGVTRSTAPDRLSGNRVVLTGSETPWSICSKIMQEAEEVGAQPDQIWVPSTEVSALMEELQRVGVQHRAVTIGFMDPSNLVIGVDAVKVTYLGQSCTISSDRFLIDHGARTGEDRRYVALRSAGLRFVTADGINWKDYDGDGSYLTRDPATQDNQAEYGAFGELIAQNPLDQIVASPTAGD